MSKKTTRRAFLGTGTGWTLALLSGCSTWVERPTWLGGEKKKKEPDGVVTRKTLVGNMVRPYINYLQVESVGLVVGLHGTGCDPSEGVARSDVLTEMRTRGVDNPNAILQSLDTAIVTVRTIIPPGAKAGDPLDVEVRSADPSLTTSLRGGRMLETRLMEKMKFRDRARSGRIYAVAAGPILVDPSAEPGTPQANRGLILGGGRTTKERPLSIRMLPSYQAGKYSRCVQEAINRQFSFYERGVKVDAAKAKTGQDIELRVHPRYRNNMSRYLRVILCLPAVESTDDRIKRLQRLGTEVLDPRTTARAAIELEAAGKEAVPMLKKGLTSENSGVRLCTAESLAYLDQSCSAPVLGKLTLDYPEYRLWTLSALSSLNDYSSVEQLLLLLDSPSVTTRYGAFRALTQLRPDHPKILGEFLEERFWFHSLECSAEPMVHMTKTKRQELVLFGKGISLKGPFALEAGGSILVTCREDSPEQVRISWFSPGEQDQLRLTSLNLEEIIRAVVELGGDYPDVVQMLQKAKKCGALTCRFELDAVPKEEHPEDWNMETQADSSGFTMKNPLPDLFSATGRISLGGGDTPGEDVEQKIVTPEEEEKAGVFSWLKRDKKGEDAKESDDAPVEDDVLNGDTSVD